MNYLILSIVLCTVITLNNAVWDGGYYSNNSNPQSKMAIDTLKLITVENFKNILDIGCGSGTITSSIAQQSPKSIVVGIDISPSMIANAQKTYSSQTNLSFQVMQAANIAFEQKFDCITSFSCFHWVHEQKLALQKIYNLLNDGGTLLLTMSCNALEVHPFYLAVKKVSKRTPWNSLINADIKQNNYFPLNADELSGLLALTGFKITSCVCENQPFTFSDSLKLKEWLKGWIGALKGIRDLTADQLDKFLDAAIEEYQTSLSNSAAKTLFYNIPLVTALAVK